MTRALARDGTIGQLGWRRAKNGAHCPTRVELPSALVEYGSDFIRILQWKFLTARVFWMNATTLRAVDLFEGRPAGAVVSGLPLLSMPPRKVVRILRGAFGHLRQGGAFYQFTYGPRCPVPRAILKRFGLRASRIGPALANLPPATVYRISRRSASTEPF
jgi:phospholipid N-methyltransferase